MARLPPVHDLVGDDVRQRRDAARRGRRDRAAARRPARVRDPARPGAVRHRGPGAHRGSPRTAQRHGTLAGRVPRRHLDAVALRYALDAAGGVDGLAVTHLDVAGARPDLRVCLSYEMDGERVGRLETGPPDLDRQAALTERLLRARPVYAPLGEAVETIEDVSGAPVVLRSHGPTAADKTGVPARGARVATSGRPLT
ncbi:adenylosuccinate synthetase [Actinomadura madurae]|uniref:adenylosuccinate synthetase n=1 Tax=Actinomadura madurae TaxID=1993 RepID=UPI0027E2C750|nr:adenylosuccinate synthetase [Actinomadura madurae]